MNAMKYSRLIVFCGIIFFIIEHFIPVFYSMKSIGTLIMLFITLFFNLKYIKQFDNKFIYKVACITVGVLYLNFVLMQGNTGYGSIILLLSMLSVYVSLDIINIKYTDIVHVSYLFFICLILYYFIPKNEYNPNTISFIFASFYIFSTLIVPNNIKSYIFLLFIFVFFATSQAGSRTVMVALFCYLLFRIIPAKFYQNKYCLTALMLVLTVGSIVYVHLYIYLYMNDLVLDVFAQFSDKKFFSGREVIWLEVTNLLSEHPITGIGSNINLSSYDNLNLHNSILNLCAIYGYIIGALVIYVYIKIVVNLSEYTSSYIIKNSIAGYFFFFIVGLSETCLFFEAFGCSIPLIIAYSYRNNLILTANK